MTTPNDPYPVVISYRAYRILLASYPRRFRQQYREEMAIAFRDACREAYNRDGSIGLIGVWRHGLADLGLNAVKERTRAMVDETPTRPGARRLLRVDPAT